MRVLLMMEAEGAGAFLHRLQEVEDSLVELVRISSCAPFDHLHRLVQPLLAWKITCHALIPMERAICRKLLVVSLILPALIN